MTTKRNHQVLDPRILGRPVHLIHKISTLLRDDLSETLRARLNRRYRAQFALGPASLAPASAQMLPRRLLTYDTPVGRVGFCLDREILLCILGYRYGTHESDIAESDAPAEEPETASEERLAVTLGTQIVSVLVERIVTQLAEDAPPGQNEGNCAIRRAGGASAPQFAWTLQAEVTEPSRRASGSLQLWFEQACIATLLRSLAPAAGARAARPPNAAAPLPARLQLTLTARLLEIQTRLGQVLDLRVGDVIPVAIGAADVLIGESRLFNASVVEHKGKLHLTCFQDVE